VNKIKTFFAKISNPHINNQSQIATTGLGIFALFALFLLFEFSILLSQTPQLSSLERKTEELKTNVDSFPDKSFKVKKLNSKKKSLISRYKKLI
jgi:uncharacterized protein (DUF58 family)